MYKCLHAVPGLNDYIASRLMAWKRSFFPHIFLIYVKCIIFIHALSILKYFKESK